MRTSANTRIQGQVYELVRAGCQIAAKKRTFSLSNFEFQMIDVTGLRRRRSAKRILQEARARPMVDGPK